MRVLKKASSEKRGGKGMQLATQTINGSIVGTNPAYFNSTRSQGEMDGFSVTDEQLVHNARGGDKTALNELIERHYKTCLNVAISILRNRPDAEDEVQNACCKAYERFSQYQGDGPFAAWLNRIVANESIVRYRHQRSRRLQYLDEPLARFNSAKLEIVDNKTLPDEALGSEEVVAVVLREVSCMPPLFREVLTLRDVRQLPMLAVARELGITVPAAKSRLARARLELRGRLERHCGQNRQGTLLQGSRPRNVAAMALCD